MNYKTLMLVFRVAKVTEEEERKIIEENKHQQINGQPISTILFDMT